MNAQECVQVIAYIAARCPAMRLEDATPTAWFEDLEGFTFEDCREAARTLTANQPFVSLHELIRESRQVTNDRLGRLRAIENEAKREAENNEYLAAITAEEREQAKVVREWFRGGCVGPNPILKAVPREDPRPSATRRAEAQAELDAIRAKNHDEAS